MVIITKKYQKEYCIELYGKILEHSTDCDLILKKMLEFLKLGIFPILHFPNETEQYQEEYCLMIHDTILEHSTKPTVLLKTKDDLMKLGIYTNIRFPIK